MLSDMVWRGSFHRHIMTSGGRTARAAQLVSAFRFPAMPAKHTAETQTAARMPLIDTSSILKVYAPALNVAVPECTRND
jgi:hypothetical protein